MFPIIYKIDLAETNYFEVDSTNKNDTYLFESGLISPSDGKGYSILHKFTNKAIYYNYADSKNIDARTQDFFELKMAFLADSTNIDSAFQISNVVPTWWTALENNTWNDYFPNSQVLDDRGLFPFVYDEMKCGCFNGEGPASIALRGGMNPALGVVGWNNKISAYELIGFLRGVDKVYNKRFFRDRLLNLWSPGNACVSFCGPLFPVNNKANSWIHYGL